MNSSSSSTNTTRPKAVATHNGMAARDGRGFEVRSPRFSELRTSNFRSSLPCTCNPKRRHPTLGFLSPMEFEVKAGFA